MSLIVISVLFVINAVIAAYWLCQLVEVALAWKIALVLFQNGGVEGRVFPVLLFQLVWVLCIAVLSSLGILEAAAFSMSTAVLHPLWAMYSTGIGLSLFILAIIVSGRLREEIAANAARRLLPNRRRPFDIKRWTDRSER
jgi:FtsH-binding integral membrane protein